MKAMIGRSGTCSLPWLVVIFSPAGIFTRDAIVWSPCERLFQGVQGGARLEPPDLFVGQGVLALDGDALAAGLRDDHGDGLARRELREPRDADAVVLLHEVVVGRLREGQRQDALLLEVGLGDPREAPDDDDPAAEIARRHGGVLAARSLAVVLVADDDPAQTLGLELARHLREVLPLLPRHGVDALARLAGEGVDGAQEHVVADLVQVAPDEKPRAGRRDVVGRGLALGLDEDGEGVEVLAIPAREGLKKLEPLTVGLDLDLYALAVGRGRLVALLTLGEALGRKLFRLRRREAERFAVRARDGPVHRVELERAREGHRGHDLGARQEGQRRGAAVVAAGEVAVERGHDGIDLVLGHVGALPLAYARPARIGEDGAADLLEGRHDAVALDRLVDALRARRDEERRLRLQSRLERDRK